MSKPHIKTFNDYKLLRDNSYTVPELKEAAKLFLFKFKQKKKKEMVLELYEHLFKNIPKYIHLTVHKHNGVGMVNGLWANSLGQGGVLPIESVLIPSKHIMSVKATGSLGEVIKESRSK